MPGEARNHNHEGTVVSYLKPQLFLNGLLAKRLARHVFYRVGCCDALVVCRIVAHHVDAVDDAVQDILTATQGAVETLAVFGRANLFCITGRYGCNGVGVVDGTKHVVDGIGIASQLACRGFHAAESQDIAEDEVAELPLERDVVDGIDGAHVFVQGKTLVELA